ncbi:MAG: CaiB/BaiF CoA transferase family protein [Hyphomicrobiaceae bacterium]
MSPANGPLPLPLDGVTVLDLSRVLAGPYCGLMLADMGADVIKVENAEGGDDTRSFLHPNFHGVSTYYLTINRNKRSVALDLKSQAGRETFIKLVAKADVVIENYRTGVMERLGLGYETLKAVRPSLIYCAISGYGRSGPNVGVPGYDPIAQAESGFMSMIGDPAGPPMRVGPSVVDLVTGLYAAQAISASLRHVALTGEGRLIETTLHETAMNMLANYSGYYLMTGRSPTRTGNANQVAQPADVYEAADGPFVMACITQPQFRSLCNDVVRLPHLLKDQRFSEGAGRLANVAELGAILSEVFATKSRDHWIASLRGAGVPAGAVATVGEALSSDLVRDRDAVRQVVHRSAGPYPALRTPARLHDTVALPPHGAPELGEHTRDVLKSLGGLSETEIDGLIKSGAARETR